MEPVLVHRHPCRITVTTAKNEGEKKKKESALASSVSLLSKTVGGRAKQQPEACVSGCDRSHVRAIKISLLPCQEANNSHVP